MTKQELEEKIDEIQEDECPYLLREIERLKVWDRDNEPFDEVVLDQRIECLKEKLHG